MNRKGPFCYPPPPPPRGSTRMRSCVCVDVFVQPPVAPSRKRVPFLPPPHMLLRATRCCCLHNVSRASAILVLCPVEVLNVRSSVFVRASPGPRVGMFQPLWKVADALQAMPSIRCGAGVEGH